MTDRELLELAAKAAGINGEWGGIIKNGEDEIDCSDIYFLEDSEHYATWNPLEDDGDALRLAVKLRIHIEWAFVGQGKPEQVNASPKGLGHCADMQLLGDDENAATRRAIVRAAAEIGRKM